MNFNLRKSLSTVVILGSLCAVMPSYASTTAKKAEKKVEKMKEETAEAARDAKRAVKKTARKVKDETCEMVNGKMECIGQKAKHTMQNAGDKIQDAIE